MSRKTKNASKKTNSSKKFTDNLADITTNFDNPTLAEYEMHFTKCRLASFSNWPFDAESSCNPTSLASAGFYHIPTSEAPDAVRCFCCYKELDGWESEDCPWDEHKKHSPQCSFLALNKPILKLTVDEFLRLECERQRNKLRKYYHAKKQLLEEQTSHVQSELTKL